MTTPNPTPPLPLEVALRRLGVERQSGHCGEGNIERADRDAHNEAVDVVLSALFPKGGSGEAEGWREISTHDGSSEPVFAICAEAQSPTPLEAWLFDGKWKTLSNPREEWSAGVTTWFPTHWMPKSALALYAHPAPKDRGEGWRGLDPATLEAALLQRATEYDDQAMDHPGTSRARPYCQAKAAGLREAVSISRNLPASPSPRDKAGEGQ